MGIGALLLAAALAGPLGAGAVDWTRGVIEAQAAAGVSLRAPTPTIARVTAERHAREAAEKRLLDAIERLPLAGGGTVGKAGKKARAALEAAVEKAEIGHARYASDGGVELALQLGLDAVSKALGEVAGPGHGAEAPPDASADEDGGRRSDGTDGAAEGTAGRILVVAAKAVPVLVPGVAARYYGSLDEAKKDPRLGEHPKVVHTSHLAREAQRGGPVAIVFEGK
jgi:hypothetical protein